MSLEIERKFLVHKDKLPKLQRGRDIYQGYLSLDPSVRFRIIEHKLFLTVKEYYNDGSRFELETERKEITDEEKAKLIQLAVVPPIVKTRYCVEYEKLTWEIDVYHEENEGLITVDVEIPSLNYDLVFPIWVDVSRDITHDKKYSNQELGVFPYSKWID
jgi:CYTH domain-containing protein